MKSFLRVPQKVHHGLLLVTDLAEHFSGGKPLSLGAIAKREQISRGFLEEIAAALRKAGVIASRRGTRGGYVLARDPETITVSDVLVALDGPLSVVECLDGEGNCAFEAACSSRHVWATIQHQVHATLATLTIADVLRTTAAASPLPAPAEPASPSTPATV